MTGYFISQLRKKISGITQAELARALEISPVTVNRWENDDPRYKPSDMERRLLEALDELADRLRGEAQRRELRDLLRVSTVAGVIAKAAIERLLKVSTITLLAATPGLGWLGLVADIGVGAALPFFSQTGNQAPAGDSIMPEQAKSAKAPLRTKRGARKREAETPAPVTAPPELASLYSLNVETL